MRIGACPPSGPAIAGVIACAGALAGLHTDLAPHARAYRAQNAVRLRPLAGTAAVPLARAYVELVAFARRHARGAERDAVAAEARRIATAEPLRVA